ncbi:hypothetical protein J4232_00735 [Candidatus Woesearchaeota archaeon]|nr:hypothetical protein [Candidatus Woesearchaeota archaeon]
MIYIIEHLDGNRLYKWCFLEYKHISEIVGKDNLLFTNIKSKKAKEQLLIYGKVESKSITELQLKKVCILDQLADKILSPNDKNNFDCFIFGGILGDYPPRKRTKEKLSDKLLCEKRSLGNKQMSTDTAVYTAKKILDGTTFEKLEFQDELEIPVKDGLSIELPYRYIKEYGKIIISNELVAFMKKKKGI